MMDLGLAAYPNLKLGTTAGGRSLITLAFAALFGAENIWWHILLNSLLALLIVSILFVTFELAHPFTSGIAIKPDSYEHVLEMIKAK